MRTSAGTQWQDTQTSACHFPELCCLFNVPAVNAPCLLWSSGVFPQIVTCGAMLQVWESVPKTTPALPHRSGHGYNSTLWAKDCIIEQHVVFIVHCTIWSIISISYCLYWVTSASHSQVSDWAVDYSVPGGTDKEGWQYAADFPVYVDFKPINRTVARHFYLKLIYVVCSFRTFHGYKTMKDFVRRRRWARLVHIFATFEYLDSLIDTFIPLFFFFFRRNLVSL